MLELARVYTVESSTHDNSAMNRRGTQFSTPDESANDNGNHKAFLTERHKS